MIAAGLRWALYLGMATVACLALFFAFFLGGSGFFTGLAGGSHGHLTVNLVKPR